MDKENGIILSDQENARNFLWKKYLAKKKSLGKAMFRVDEFHRLDEHAFEQWLGTFAGSRMAEAFILKHEYRRRSDFQDEFRELCRMRKTSPGEMIFAVQKLCIEQNRFFWGVVHNLCEQAREDMRKRYRQAMKDFLSASDAGRDTDPETIKNIFETFQDFCNSEKTPTGTGNTSKTHADESDISDREKEIKKLYRTLCLKHHPDKTGVYNESLWVKIQSAYERCNVKELRELLNAPVLKNIAMTTGLTCEEIIAMTRDLEARFKPVRADWKKAKNSLCWQFRNWDDTKKARAKDALIRNMDNEINTVKTRLLAFQGEMLDAIENEPAATRHKRKSVRIEITADYASRRYQIHLEYLRHTEDIAGTVPKKSDEDSFNETCVLAALRTLKAPCKVYLIVPTQMALAYHDVKFAEIYGGDISNQFARHIVKVLSDE